MRLLGRPPTKKALGPIANPNWAAFVMLVTLLSVLNAILITFMPLPDGAKSTLNWINVSISFILWGDFFFMLHRAHVKREFMKGDYGWLALLGSFPYLRSLRVIWFWLVLRKYGKKPRDLLAEISINRDAQGTLLLVLFIVLIVFQSAVVFILFYESPIQDSNIKTVSDAFWWAFTTGSTVGYGDKYPVTEGGRLVGLSLMIVGIALFSVVTGTLAQWFVRSSHAKEEAEEKADLAARSSDIAEIKQLLYEQNERYQQGVERLDARIAELEAQLKERR
jgi:voltage-gated potassium channel